MAGVFRSQKHFSIDEAFEEDNDDTIRVYGSTNDRSIKNKKFTKRNESDPVGVYIEDPHYRIPLPSDDAVSRDSDSLMRRADSPEDGFDPSQPCWRHPKIRENWKIVLAAGALLIVGIGLFVIGVVLTMTASFTQGIVFFIAGVICFIPGIYHIVYIYFAVKGRRGYYFYHLPLFN